MIKILFTALLFFQGALVVTGGAVRLTGSGLGCPTWPECTKGSIKPIAHQAQGQLHAWIEFGNRLIAWLIFFLAIAAVIIVIKRFKGRSEYLRMRTLAQLQLLGFVGQVLLGGITVLTKLNPISVSAHFILSIPLIAGALSLRSLVLESKKVELAKSTYSLTRILIFLTIIVLAVGTIVTGTGPHAGDIQAQRYKFDPRTISWIHADIVIALIFLTLSLVIVTSTVETSLNKKIFGQKLWFFFGIILLQGLIGYVQYFTKLPELLVAAHLLGATLVWITAWNLAITSSANRFISNQNLNSIKFESDKTR